MIHPNAGSFLRFRKAKLQRTLSTNSVLGRHFRSIATDGDWELNRGGSEMSGPWEVEISLEGTDWGGRDIPRNWQTE
jgi:hypothetical protein